jgi:hypothetical protein
MTIAVMFFSGYRGFWASALLATRRAGARRKSAKRAGRLVLILVVDMISLPQVAKISLFQFF